MIEELMRQIEARAKTDPLLYAVLSASRISVMTREETLARAVLALSALQEGYRDDLVTALSAMNVESASLYRRIKETKERRV